ncbi:membrane protein insertion efficiency factor YidD [Listeria innocua]|nr:membrane protein insertion efficiency factor YidD [Listeria innocua]EEJ1215446.1 membrane protein insertion efficiency factor YidD [Listeria innocua]HCJ4458131.1 membrane protein insertion efficiency factor YidD [Listeria innocua]HDA9556525.1 membrane protein insertion efficiency factor YidD [Listeria innocua]
MKKMLIGGIRLYQKYISRFTPATCRFYPTCSAYGIEAIETHGALKGSYLAIRRISKCHPFHKGGLDFVPPKKDKNDDSSHTFKAHHHH